MTNRSAKVRGPSSPLRVALVAAHPLRVLGFQALFEDNPAVAIVAAEMADVLHDKTLHVVLLGSQPAEPLLELIATLRAIRPELRVIVMGDAATHDEIERIVAAGARGYLPQTATESEILMALREVFDGSVWAPRRVLSRLIDQVPAAPAVPAPAATPAPEHGAQCAFTAREAQVLELLITGASNRQIGQALQIEERTVKSHLASLMRKVGVQNRIALSMHALTRDLLRKPE